MNDIKTPLNDRTDLRYYLHDDPRVPGAWAPWFSHEYITYFSVLPLDGIMALPAVPAMRNPLPEDAGWPLGPKHVDLFKENYRKARTLDHIWSYDYGMRNGDFSADPGNAKALPWQVLFLYSTEPDLKPDCDLDLHEKQALTGGSHGWRHMRFRVLGREIGIARRSFQYHVDRAGKAFSAGSGYWGWRLLSRATHYLADLGNPFHVKAAPLPLLLMNLRSPKKLFRVITAAHHTYEVYAERRFREGFAPFRDALVRGSAEGAASGDDVMRHLDRYIRQSERRLVPLFRYFGEQYGQELVDAYSSMDRNNHLDAASSSQLCSADAARIIFRESNLPKLTWLDEITEEILFDVGKMLGMLLQGFTQVR